MRRMIDGVEVDMDPVARADLQADWTAGAAAKAAAQARVELGDLRATLVDKLLSGGSITPAERAEFNRLKGLAG